MSFIKKLFNPFELIRAFRFDKKQKKHKKSSQDLELMLYSKIIRNDIDNVPPGHPGVNSLIYTLLNEVSEKKINLSELIKYCSVNPAKRFNIFPKYGELYKGGLANITVIDLKKKHKYSSENQFSKAKNSDVLYANKEFNGKIDYTIINGKIAYDGNTIIEKKYGKFINPNNKK